MIARHRSWLTLAAAAALLQASCASVETACDAGLAREIFQRRDDRATVPTPIIASPRGYFFFRSRFYVDADGAPRAYNAANTGYLDVCNGAGAYDAGADRCITDVWNRPSYQRCIATFRQAVAEGFTGPAKMCTYGYATHGGVRRGSYAIGGIPFVQGAGDPAPGFFVSTTTAAVPGGNANAPSGHYDAARIPYVAIPPALRARIRMGDLVLLHHTETRRSAFAIVADGGPADGLGEGSMAAYQLLDTGIIREPADGESDPPRPYRLRDGILRVVDAFGDRVFQIHFPNSRTLRAGDSSARIQADGAAHARRFGGAGTLIDCAMRAYR